MTYKTSLMRTHAGYGREDMNIEDIHCQIVMRTQRNNQLLRDLEGGSEQDAHQFGLSSNAYNYDQGTTDMTASVIPCKEPEILGPDYCSKRPVFLSIHFPDMRVPFKP